MNRTPTTVSSFRVITIFILLSIIGIALIPLVKMQYQPSTSQNSLTVRVGWPRTGPEVIEREVTAKLEDILASVPNTYNIESWTQEGFASVSLYFHDDVDLDKTRMEISTLLRQLSTKLPEGASYPTLSYGGGGGGNNSGPKHLFTYTLTGKYSARELQSWAENTITPDLTELKDIAEVNVTGGDPIEWELIYDRDKLTAYGISTNDIQNAIRTYTRESPLGLVEMSDQSTIRKLAVRLQSDRGTDFPVHKIPVKKVGDRIIYLSSLVKLEQTVRDPDRYFRVNGLEAVNVTIYASETSNILAISKLAADRLRQIQDNIPENMEMILVWDSTERLNEELLDISWRVALSIVILLLFTWLISRSLRYMFIVIASIGVNIAIAFICYYLIGVELHLFSLAGLTISLGIIIDNSIVMIDHIRLNNNKKVFVAIMAATLTTVGSLSILYFLDREEQRELLDFAYVLAINLIISLFISLYFIPAILDKLPLRKRISKRTIRGKRRVVWVNRVYIPVIGFITKWRKWVLVALVLLFGLPIYLLPDKLGERNEKPEDLSTGEKIYNATIGNEWYQKNLHDHVKTWLGGTLQLFHGSSYQSYYRSGGEQQTTLYVNGSMPPGANIHQLNEVFKELENFISQFEEVDRFETNITGIRSASIRITFDEAHEMTAFPYYLKARLEEKAISIGGMDSRIYGVGQGFSNSLSSGYRNTNLYLYGYNYKNLIRIAEELREQLLSGYTRIKEVDILGRPYSYGKQYQYRMDLDKNELARLNMNTDYVYRYINDIGTDEVSVFRGEINGINSELRLRPREEDRVDAWNVNNYPLMSGDSSMTKLASLGTVKQEQAAQVIFRQNQQYRIIVAFDYIGSYQLKNAVVKKFIEETNDILPVGYKIQERQYDYRQPEGTKYWLLGLVLVIIFIIGSALFESLRQPLIVLLIIPMAFIGIFLTFHLFELPFGQGGYASMILICGIAVNSGFFIANDYNNTLKATNGRALRSYLKAYQHKVMPILLTISSTVAGMIPFLIEAKLQSFWFSLAAGTVGGLLFSMLGVILFLPLLIKRKYVK